MTDFLEGFLKGAQETLLAYFAPAIPLWQWLRDATKSLFQEKPWTS